MREPRCDEHVGEPYPRRCADCDRVAAVSRRADEVSACNRHVRMLPCPECARAAAHSGPTSPRDASTADESGRPVRSLSVPVRLPTSHPVGEGSQNLAPEARWDRLG